MEVIRWFDTLARGDVNIAGGKGANLGELVKAGTPVPPGFVIAAPAFRLFLQQQGTAEAIKARVEAIDVNDTAALERTARELQVAVEKLAIPPEIAAAILAAYHQLAQGEQPCFVAVRSSATAEDAPHTSFAGMNETFLNVRGDEALLDAVRRCYASLYGARVLFYRRTEEIPEEKMSIAVIVERMVNSRAAGVMFTVHPATGDTNLLVIEGAFGLGEAVVSGEVNPDHYEVRKDTRAIFSRTIMHKDFRYVRDAEGNTVREELSGALADAPCLTDEQVVQLAEMGLRIEAHYGAVQDIEWAMEDGTLYIVQSRPVTATGQPPQQAGATHGEILVRGLAASPGMAYGKVHVLQSPQEAADLRKGDILVTRMTSPDWVPIMKLAGAIVTDEGGMTSHAAIVSRELGIPCIVGTRTATQLLHTGQLVTVDARAGMVFAGMQAAEKIAAPPPAPTAPARIITGTKLYVNLAQPEMAEEMAARDVDGVGLLRAEFIMQDVSGGVHPRVFLDDGKADELRDRLAAQLLRFARAFTPRPVIYRSLDFRSNEYRGMQGGEKYEREEANPMIGYRGCFRNISEPDLFNVELEAIKQVRSQGLANLHLMIPFVRTRWEFARCKALIDASGLTAQRDFDSG